ncbi:MAG: HAD family hydrolase [Rhodobacter sp.]|nr:HAD family hydrolase [Rhodobacter sp.]
MRIAMWSGPRNLSTAMMYAFAQRSDCAVWDEPFYAAYLAATGLQHPMRDAVIDQGEVDPEAVITKCLSDREGHLYLKLMTHHMLPGFRRDWLADVTNVFLIRHPARAVASYLAKRENPTLDDLGFRQQAELFDAVLAMGQTPLVIDSHEIREDPEKSLTRLCTALGLEFDPAMLRWPAGGNAADGIWAAHWYPAVHGSTGFAGPEGDLPELSGKHAEMCRTAMPFYDRLRASDGS